MRTATQTTTTLVKAAQAVLNQVENGELFDQAEPAMSNNVKALDQLATAAEAEQAAGIDNRLRMRGMNFFGVEQVTAEPKRSIGSNGQPFWMHIITLYGGDGFEMEITAYYNDVAEAQLEADYQARQQESKETTQ
ncbi:hypothetical protein [Crenobacter cavernae]|uniref:Uncharacterized protein n=1 Tax=Crenobacter cavernae TaxID=2290923 RepID=A0A345Y6U0_9NEIS|nr:hypothetical protein [Crenobacter cavernae]AXK39642.1 hypothetical protein DWG20_09400 [Crenobacter cavernae]